MARKEISTIIQWVSISSAILTPLLVAFFGYYNAQNIQSVKTGYDYAQFKLEKLQDAYDKTNVPLNSDLQNSISSQLQDRHHATRERWEMVRPYVSQKRSGNLAAVDAIGEQINQFYIDSARAKQKGETYTLSNSDDFGRLLYDYYDDARKIIREEISETIAILDQSNR
jgi:hypothetical protein